MHTAAQISFPIELMTLARLLIPYRMTLAPWNAPMIRFPLICGFIVCFLVCCQSMASAQNPNILLIMADDLGFSDLGSYGGEIDTPNLDALADNGLKFKNFNVAPRCSPTRGALMTGHQNHKLGFNVLIGNTGQLNQNHVFLPELLKANDYHTYLSGKWHLGNTTNFGNNGTIPGNQGVDPRVRGFDHAFTFNASGHSADNWNIGDYRLLSSASTGNPAITERTYQEHPGSTTYIPGTTFYQTDAIADYTLDFLQHHRDRNTAGGTNDPFFNFVAFGAPHFPIQAPKDLVDSYVSRYEAGWDAVRADRLDSMIDLGIIPADVVLTGRSDVPQTKSTSNTNAKSAEVTHQIRAWDTLDSDRQADLTRRMAAYAAMVDNMDHNIGRIIDDLDANGELDNTIVMFMSDNGGDAEWHEFGRRDNEPARTGLDLENMGTNADTGETVFYGSGWANVSNTPFVNYKHYTHEGGVNSPLIVHWPAGIDPNRAGEIVGDHTQVNDIMPTLLDVLEIDLPEQWQAQNGTIYDVENFDPTLRSLEDLITNGTPIGDREIGIQHEGNRAYQKGSMKLVSSNFAGTDGTGANEWELYDLSVDPTEQNNLAGDPNFAAIYDELLLRYDFWAFRNNVTSSLTNLASDFNLDGLLNAADLQIFKDNWLQENSGQGTIGEFQLGDRNLDGINDLRDWALIRQDFAQAGNLSVLSAVMLTVPEPATFLLLAFAGTLFLSLLRVHRNDEGIGSSQALASAVDVEPYSL